MADIAADTTTTAAVAVGGSATGEIETAADKDWFEVELEAGRTYRFDLQGAPGGHGTLSDTFLRRILDAEGNKSTGDGQHRTYNDDFQGSRDSRVTFTATEAGTYYVEASGDRDETGTYRLTVTDVTPEPEVVPDAAPVPEVVPDVTPEPEVVKDAAPVPVVVKDAAPVPVVVTDIAADTTTTAAVAVGGSATGEIETAGDKDWFEVELEAGRIYRFDLQGAPGGHGTLSDTFLRRILDAEGNKSTGDGQAPDLQRRLPGLARQPGDVHGDGGGDVLCGGIGRPRRDGHLQAHGDGCHARAGGGEGCHARAGGGAGCHARAGGGGAGEANHPAAVWRGRPAVRQLVHPAAVWRGRPAVRQLVRDGFPPTRRFSPTARRNRS